MERSVGPRLAWTLREAIPERMRRFPFDGRAVAEIHIVRRLERLSSAGSNFPRRLG